MQISELYALFLAHPVVTTDTRNCPEGSIFFALRGETFNGNDFALRALEAGCAHAVVDDPALRGADERLIAVDDVLTTLQALAHYHREHLHTPIIQITGTNGKTTTKELTAAVLSKHFQVLYTQGNFNNHIGVPKTLLRLTSADEIAVIETGANHPGEIDELSQIVDADCGLITNVGRAHLEGFGSFEGVVKTKGELYDYLRSKANSFIFLDATNQHLAEIAHDLPAVTYGLRTEGQSFHVEGEVLCCDPMLNFRFRMDGGEWLTVKTQLIGAYNVGNALAAIAVGTHFGVTPTEAAEAIAAYRPGNNRSELMKTASNELIVDAYNANPTSMKAALDNFALIEHPHKMMILGEMRELGLDSAGEHAEVVRHALSLRCEALWLVGEEFYPFAEDDEAIQWFPDVEAVKTALVGGDRPTDRLILIKGSNGTKLFQLPELL